MPSYPRSRRAREVQVNGCNLNMIVVYEKRPESAANAAAPRFRHRKSSRRRQTGELVEDCDWSSANKKAEASKASAVVDFGV
jgi:hypothetical protein